MSGYPLDKLEELVGRLMSVVDSTDHFIALAPSVLDKVSNLSVNSIILQYACTVLLYSTIHVCIFECTLYVILLFNCTCTIELI